MIEVLPLLVGFMSIIVAGYKVLKASKIDEFFFSLLMKKVPKLEKYMLIPKVASLAIKFDAFVKDDLSDGQLDNLMLFESFLRAIKVDKNKLDAFLKTF